MVPVACLADINPKQIAMFIAVLKHAGIPIGPSIATLDVPELGRLSPGLLICDVDALAVDPLEMLRQVRFVLPGCIVVVYTGDQRRAWGVACHLAGANGVLCKSSTEAQLVAGMRAVMWSGCYTDPTFAAA